MKTSHTLLLLASLSTSLTLHAAPNERALEVSKYWTAERMAAAQPRDFVIDKAGNAYMRSKDGKLTQYGEHKLVSATTGKPGRPVTRGKPGGGGNDTGAADISNMTPDGTQMMGTSINFSATVTDPDTIKSVTFVVNYPNNVQSTSFTASPDGNDSYSVPVNGFSDGIWSWEVVVKDNAAKGGNTYTSDTIYFDVSTSGGGDTGGGDTGGGGGTGGSGNDADLVQNEHFTLNEPVKTAAGRIYFEMPANRKGTRWNGYVCSGTVIKDGTTPDHSTILTAAHCVYDDVNKMFARNVMFIPNQDETTGSGTDRNCSNDPHGCWWVNYGVVAEQWAQLSFSENIQWDSAFYIVDNQYPTAEHENKSVLENTVDNMSLDFSYAVSSSTEGAVITDPSYTMALGYSYSDDPNFMHCAENLTPFDTTANNVNWWLGRCQISGGSSGGPWLQGSNLISVNSWGYTTSDGMAGPIFGVARTSELFNSIGQPLTHERGIIVP
jgi:hypothetical protein